MIIFDVGANNGETCFYFTENENNTVYAFEPTPQLVQGSLLPKSAARKNFITVPKAVSNKSGIVKFNIAGHGNWGCSSLYDFSDDLDKTWPGRNDFYYESSVDVECITMKQFLDENPSIQKIDLFHCDTQGNDMNCILGLEEHIGKVINGEIEVVGKNPLYKNTNNNLEFAIEYLESQGFRIWEVSGNDPQGNEINVKFTRQSVNPKW